MWPSSSEDTLSPVESGVDHVLDGYPEIQAGLFSLFPAIMIHPIGEIYSLFAFGSLHGRVVRSVLQAELPHRDPPHSSSGGFHWLPCI
jgi:hypothetical protein